MLEGEALAVWMELTKDQQKIYATAKKNGDQDGSHWLRIDDVNFSLENLCLLNLKRLLDQAMPNLEKNARSKLVLHQFIAGLPVHISTQLRSSYW